MLERWDFTSRSEIKSFQGGDVGGQLNGRYYLRWESKIFLKEQCERLDGSIHAHGRSELLRTFNNQLLLEWTNLL